MHPIVVPFNLFSVPIWYGLFGRTNDADRKVVKSSVLSSVLYYYTAWPNTTRARILYI